MSAPQLPIQPAHFVLRTRMPRTVKRPMEVVVEDLDDTPSPPTAVASPSPIVAVKKHFPRIASASTPKRLKNVVPSQLEKPNTEVKRVHQHQRQNRASPPLLPTSSVPLRTSLQSPPSTPHRRSGSAVASFRPLIQILDLSSLVLTGDDWLSMSKQLWVEQDFVVHDFISLVQFLQQGSGFEVFRIVTKAILVGGVQLQQQLLGAKSPLVTLQRLPLLIQDLEQRPATTSFSYFFVDLKLPRSQFTDAGAIKFSQLLDVAHHCTLIVNTKKCVSRCHKDQMDAIVMLLEGRKVFRIQVHGTCNPSERDLVNPKKCPPGFVDKVIVKGDFLYVPKQRRHLVFSDELCVLLSLTLKDGHSARNASIFGANLSNDTPDSPMSVDSTANNVADEISSPATSNMTDGVTTQRSDQPLHEKDVADNNSSSATSNANYVVVTAPRSEHSLPAQLMTTPVSLLSVVSREWKTDSFAGVKVFPASTERVRVMSEMATMMFGSNGVPLPEFIVSCGWKEMFGQLFPKHKDDMVTLSSARVMTPFDSIKQHRKDIWALIRIVIKDIGDTIATEISQTESLRIKFVSGVVMMRFRGRIPSQILHFDSGSEKAGVAQELSVIVPFSDQHNVLFVDLTSARLSLPKLCPRVRQAELLTFCANEKAHCGVSAIDAGDGKIVTSALFMDFAVTRNDEMRYPDLKVGVVDPTADYFLFNSVRQPAVLKCVCCEHPIVNRLGIQICNTCVKDGHSQTAKLHFGDITGVVCDNCVTHIVEPHSIETLVSIRGQPDDSGVLKFMTDSCMTTIPGHSEWKHKLCAHSSSTRKRFPTSHYVLLYFTTAELKHSATWLLSVLVGNELKPVNMTEQVQQLSRTQGDKLAAFASYCGDNCSRASVLASLVMMFSGISIWSRSAHSSKTLFTEAFNAEYETTTMQRVTKLADFVAKPVTLALIVELSESLLKLVQSAKVTEEILCTRCRHHMSDQDSGFKQCWPKLWKVCSQKAVGATEGDVDQHQEFQSELRSFFQREHPVAAGLCFGM